MNQGKNKFQLIMATISTLYLVIFSYGAYLVISQFEKMFQSLDAKLPIQTTLVLITYKYWGVLAVISALILFKLNQSKSHVLMVVLATIVVFSLLLMPFSIWALYSPTLEGNT